MPWLGVDCSSSLFAEWFRASAGKMQQPGNFFQGMGPELIAALADEGWNGGHTMKESTKIALGGSAVCALLVGIVVTAFEFTGNGLHCSVNYGHVGVYNRFGAILPGTLAQGFHWKDPFSVLVETNTQLTPYAHKVEAASRNLQKVVTEVTVTYSQTAAMAPETLQNIGDASKLEAAVLLPAIEQSVKSVTAAFTAEELVTQRPKVMTMCEQEIRQFIDHTLSQKKVVGAIEINSIALTNFSFSAEFDRSIEEKVRSDQEALKAENDKKRKITDAEAQAESKKKVADAEAYQIERMAKARAQAISLEGEALKKSPEMARLRAIEKWTGTLPTFLGGNTPIPFLALDDMKRAAPETVFASKP